MVKIKEECTGCMACRNICPAGAIGTKRNENGFLMPVVDSSRCMHCGQCEEACPLEGKDSGRPDPKKAYAMYHLSEHVVSISSSGGAFYALASEVLKQGGIVFGCYLDVKKKMAYLADTDHMPLEKLLTRK